MYFVHNLCDCFKGATHITQGEDGIRLMYLRRAEHVTRKQMRGQDQSRIDAVVDNEDGEEDTCGSGEEEVVGEVEEGRRETEKPVQRTSRRRPAAARTGPLPSEGTAATAMSTSSVPLLAIKDWATKSEPEKEMEQEERKVGRIGAGVGKAKREHKEKRQTGKRRKKVTRVRNGTTLNRAKRRPAAAPQQEGSTRVDEGSCI